MLLNRDEELNFKFLANWNSPQVHVWHVTKIFPDCLCPVGECGLNIYSAQDENTKLYLTILKWNLCIKVVWSFLGDKTLIKKSVSGGGGSMAEGVTKK